MKIKGNERLAGRVLRLRTKIQEKCNKEHFALGSSNFKKTVHPSKKHKGKNLISVKGSSITLPSSLLS